MNKINKTSSSKRKSLQTLLVSLVILASSCEKVVDISLNNAEKRYVVEAILTDQPGSARVKITQTKDFTEDNNFPGISGATVQITETGGGSFSLSETSPGVYQNSGLTGIPGKSYQLSVNVNGQNFTADCSMPLKVTLDTLFVTDELLFTDTRKIANIGFQEPAGRGNSYRFVQFINERPEDDLLIDNDDYTDGRPIRRKLYFFANKDENEINSGDTLLMDMQCIDPTMYKYWFSLDRSASGQSGQAAPSNPVSNMKGGALGYFSAHTSDKHSLIVP